MGQRKRRLLVPERHGRILEYLQANQSASVQALRELTGASESTIRRDLLELSVRASGVRRTHGGVVSGSLQSSTYEPPAQVAARQNIDGKRRIGLVAAQWVAEGQSVMFDSGSTVREAARAIAARGLPLTAITNDLSIAQLLNAAAAIRIIVTGGTLRHNSDTLFGPPAESLLAGVHADVLFLGAHAVAESGLSESSMEIAEIKRRMIASARSVVLLADRAKFDRRAFARICELSMVSAVVTDASPPPAMAEAFAALGIPVRIV